jgi:hypothetical protein
MPRAKRETNVAKTNKKLGEQVPEIVVTDNHLRQISELAKLQFSVQKQIAELEDALVVKRDELKRISEEDLPTAMIEAQIDKFVTQDGLEVSWRAAFTTNIKKSNKEAAFEWLIENDFGGLIKVIVDVHFERGQREKATKLAEQLRKKNVDVDVKETIHPQTLKSFVNEQMSRTDEDETESRFPATLFGAYPYNIATVKPPKEAPKKKKR